MRRGQREGKRKKNKETERERWRVHETSRVERVDVRSDVVSGWLANAFSTSSRSCGGQRAPHSLYGIVIPISAEKECAREEAREAQEISAERGHTTGSREE